MHLPFIIGIVQPESQPKFSKIDITINLCCKSPIKQI